MSKKSNIQCAWCGDNLKKGIVKDNLTFCDNGCLEEYEAHSKPKVLVDVGRVDWFLLRGQKEALVLKRSLDRTSTEQDPDFGEVLSGLIGLIDDIQDQAALTLGEEIVFGKKAGVE